MASLQRLENGTVFTVHRKDLHTTFLCKRHNDMPCRNQCLFICKGNILSGFDRCNCRTDADPYPRSPLQGSHFLHHWQSPEVHPFRKQPLHPDPDPAFQFLCLLFCPHCHKFLAGDSRICFFQKDPTFCPLLRKSPVTSISLFSRITSSVWVLIEPVEPNIAIFFI